jgi:hypothetical protein
VGIRLTARVRPPGRSLLDEYELAPNDTDAAIHVQVIGQQLAALVTAIANAARRTAAEYSLLRIPLTRRDVQARLSYASSCPTSSSESAVTWLSPAYYRGRRTMGIARPMERLLATTPSDARRASFRVPGDQIFPTYTLGNRECLRAARPVSLVNCPISTSTARRTRVILLPDWPPLTNYCSLRTDVCLHGLDLLSCL